MKNTDIRTFFKLSTIPILVFIFLVTIPTFLLKNDIWDGVLIEYAAEIKDFRGLKNWFYESTWYLQYPFVLSVIKLSLKMTL